MEDKDPKKIAREILNKSKEEEHFKKVKNARIVLIVLGILNFLVGLYYFSQPYMEIEAYTGMGMGTIFVGLFFLGAKTPRIALIIGLVFFLTIHILSAIVEPDTIVKGIVLKVIFTILLIRGIISVNSLPNKKPGSSDELLDDL